VSFNPTPEQQRILDEPGNCVVLAKPGSGKTSTLACKIQSILPNLPLYRGIIAISYTNKASQELKKRCLSGGLERKGTFFGTIDSFFYTEIIIPFGSHLFGLPESQICTIKLEETQQDRVVCSKFILEQYDELTTLYFPWLSDLYKKGNVILESYGFLALYIFRNSFACRRYLKAKYSHIVIDEYQDCGDWQHAMFLALVDLDLQGIAVGDPDQSIFAFADKDPKYLLQLARRDDFRPLPINKNHRCHPSIVNYSLRLLNPQSPITETDSCRVIRKHIKGSEISIGRWLSKVIPLYAEKCEVEKLSDIAILVKDSPKTGRLIHENLSLPHKPIATSSLDNDSSRWGALFSKVLSWVFSAEQTKHELIEEYLSFDDNIREIKEVMTLLKKIEVIASSNHLDLQQSLSDFLSIAEIIFPGHARQESTENLVEVLKDTNQLAAFIPPKSDEIQIMTLHKSKGLEFDILFHLNLYQYILPQYNGDYSQDLNLHYVGITRAKKACVFCTSTHRHKKYGEKPSPSNPSEFLGRHDLVQLRKEI